MKIVALASLLFVIACQVEEPTLGSAESEIYYQDSDAPEVPGYMVFIRLIGRHPSADPNGPGYVDYDNYDDRGAHYCGGVLVADDWVLTASHCLYKGFPTGVNAGKRYLLRLDQFEVVHDKLHLPGSSASAQRRVAAGFQFHPSAHPHGIGTEIERTDWYGMDWQCEIPPSADQNNLAAWNHDFALIKLSRPFDNVSPVKVASTLNPWIVAEPGPQGPVGPGGKSSGGRDGGETHGEEGKALPHPQLSGWFHGWGATTNYVWIEVIQQYLWLNIPRSNVLRRFWGKPVHSSHCPPGMQAIIDSSEFCLEANNGQATLGIGDSGGPFVINNQLVGIAHAGVATFSAAGGYSVLSRGPVARSWVNSTIANGGTQYAPDGCPNMAASVVDDCRLDGCGPGEHCHDCPEFTCMPANVWCY